MLTSAVWSRTTRPADRKDARRRGVEDRAPFGWRRRAGGTSRTRMGGVLTQRAAAGAGHNDSIGAGGGQGGDAREARLDMEP
jgi:hypothetical protein